MPDLTETAATVWLAEIQPATPADLWPPPVRPIEAGDSEPLLEEVGNALDATAAADPERLSCALREDPLRNELQTLLAQLGAARALRTLHWLSEAELPHSHDVLTALTQGHGTEARALRATITAITRTSTLRRMFAVHRLTALQDAAATAFKETS